ncbi:alpha/beta-hydrolase [Aspergillus steynii IBT 23096]|uniref:Alpha/beta-hydrolase n=1 Tax=Aspergillus steynii IBT 23096 TaxID=1392250 RepID=A0A2I2G900_9EURO|nr:alpha/beta-hydrolase [Aspergillus steynii IBT 23096]PLB49313.1 alpha/beta-hydrolase [Aspergillus steynii IBT 23096]
MRYITTALLLFSHSLVEALPHESNHEQTLHWAPCDLDFPNATAELIKTPVDCAKLRVPLDYTYVDSGETIELQLVKINATKKPVEGSIIFNPGGPGGSGVEEVSTKGPMYREVFGGHFNVIGFDPRGTGKTLPFSCDLKHLGNAKLSRRLANSTLPQADLWGLLKSKAWSDGGWFADACYDSQKDTGRYLSTAFTARDLLNIVDALNEDGQLRFWGRSYSTTLGQTFAAMFPDRVGRLLLDSVQDPRDYHSGQWLDSTRDTHISLLNFFTECIRGGPSVCPFANFSGPSTTPQSLLSELTTVFQELVDNPVYLHEDYHSLFSQPWWRPGPRPLLPELKYFFFNFLYQPASFAQLSLVTSVALSRNWTSFTSPTPEVPVPPKWSEGSQAFHGIACADMSLRAQSPDDLYSLVQAELETGGFSDAFMPQLWPCYQWRMQAVEQFKGEFKNINTSYPPLFVNGAYDPVTPLSGAWRAASAFKGSRLLVHKGHGHGVMNHPSECTIKAIGAYFANGTLPEHGTVCEPIQPAYELWEEANEALEEQLEQADTTV